MSSWRKFSLILLTLLFLAPTFCNLSMVNAGEVPDEQKNWKWEPYGPRVDTYLMPIYLDYDAQLMAFKKGEIDTSFIQAARVDEVKDDPNIYLLSFQTFNLQFLGINTALYPWNYTAIRQAIAHLIDRDWIVREIYHGFGYPVDAPIPPAFGDWSNPNVTSYAYSKDLAKKVLLDAGFTYDEAAGKWYDPSGREIPEFYIQVPPAEQAPWLYQEAQHIVEDANDIGLPLKVEAIEFQALVSQIYSRTFKSFILYLGWGRQPTLAYELFRTGGSWNFWGISDPELDEWLEKFYFTTDMNEAKQWLWKVQERVAEILPYIPIYMGRGNVGFRADIAGIVMLQPLGGQSYLTILDVHHVGLPFGGSYRDPLGSDPRTLNVFTAITGDELDVIDNILESLFIADPDQVSDDLPWLAKSWTMEEIEINGSKATKITFYLFDNITWHDGVKFTAKDVAFTWNFIKEKKPTQQYAMVFEKMIKTEVVDDYTVAAYINGTSWTYLYDLNVLIVPEHIWGNETLLEEHGGWERWDPSKVPHPTVEGLTCLVGTGPYIFAERKPGEYILLKWNYNYWRRHPGKSLSLTFTSTESLYAGDVLDVSATVQDYTGSPATNATVLVEILQDGSVVKSVSATHTGNGVYTASVDTGDLSGTYTVRVTASAEILGYTFTKSAEASLTVKPAYEKYLPYIIVVAVIVVIVVIVIALRRR
ncbi:hypothetical protein J7L70_09160 [Candidatus Bathyarchaeota archaeon]|nr:hypothetical protein [Candidatus Bathyarchaeota archaeon]